MSGKRMIPECAYPPLLGDIRIRHDVPFALDGWQQSVSISRTMRRHDYVTNCYFSAFWDVVAPMRPKVLIGHPSTLVGAGTALNDVDLADFADAYEYFAVREDEDFQMTLVDNYDIVFFSLDRISTRVFEYAAEKRTLIMMRQMLYLDMGRWVMTTGEIISNAIMLAGVSTLGRTDETGRHTLLIRDGSSNKPNFSQISSDSDVIQRPAFYWDI